MRVGNLLDCLNVAISRILESELSVEQVVHVFFAVVHDLAKNHVFEAVYSSGIIGSN